MECSIRGSSSTWSCQISLKLQYNGDDQIPTSTVPFGPSITNKIEVELHIRRAQAAILSPHHSPSTFLGKTYDELKALSESDPDVQSFSRNAVVVDIEDPSGADLFFVDLPGEARSSASPFRLVHFHICLQVLFKTQNKETSILSRILSWTTSVSQGRLSWSQSLRAVSVYLFLSTKA